VAEIIGSILKHVRTRLGTGARSPLEKQAPQFTATIIAASNLSFGSGALVIFSSEAHLTASAPFRVRALRPVFWVLAQGEDIVALVGARTPERLQEALSAPQLELSADDLTAARSAYGVCANKSLGLA
jgi:hypothetical protein